MALFLQGVLACFRFWFHSVLHECNCLCMFIRVLFDLCMIPPNLAPHKIFRKSAPFGQSSSITETFFASSKRRRI